MNVAFNAGLNGIQRSSRSVLDSAQNIAEQNIRSAQERVEPQSDVEAPDRAALATAPEAVSSPPVEPRESLEESVLNLRRQELLFTASAQVVETANNTVGSLIDDIA